MGDSSKITKMVHMRGDCLTISSDTHHWGYGWISKLCQQIFKKWSVQRVMTRLDTYLSTCYLRAWGTTVFVIYCSTVLQYYPLLYVARYFRKRALDGWELCDGIGYLPYNTVHSAVEVHGYCCFWASNDLVRLNNPVTTDAPSSIPQYINSSLTTALLFCQTLRHPALFYPLNILPAYLTLVYPSLS
jgi:hypothetical protein